MNQLPEIPPSEHSLQYNERLQDWLDGELNGADAAAFEAHLQTCAQCQQSAEEFEQLDTALVEASPSLHLDAVFDARLFAQIDAIDDSKRADARRRIEQEWQQQIHALSRGWRRMLAFVIPGVVAGIAVAFTLASWLDSSGVTSTLVAQGAAELGGGASDFLRVGVTAIIGAALGMLVAPWLARLAE